MRELLFLEHMSLLDDEYVEEAAPVPKSRLLPFLRASSLAACLTLALLSVLFFLPKGEPVSPPTAQESAPLHTESPPPPYESAAESVLSDAEEGPSESLEESDTVSLPEDESLPPEPPFVLETVMGEESFFLNELDKSISGDQGSSSPPHYSFQALSGVLVRARAVEVLESIYSFISSPAIKKRVILFETLEVIDGQRVPERFLLVMNEWELVDLTRYSDIVIGMKQCGTDGYILFNRDQGVPEVFPLPVFSASASQVDLLPFTDGKFDDTVWRTETWYLPDHVLEEMKNGEAWDDFFVQTGCPVEETVQRLREHIAKHQTTRYNFTVYYREDIPEEVTAYTMSFENGVFHQTVGRSSGEDKVIFRRYVNGCETDETVTFSFDTKEIEYSDARYTEKVLNRTYDITKRMKKLADAYAKYPPEAPHVKGEGLELYQLTLKGWYTMTEDGVYGVIMTTWTYRSKNNRLRTYYDEKFLLFDPEIGSYRTVERDELISLVGSRNLPRKSIGKQDIIQA